MSDVVSVVHQGRTYALFFRKDISTENGVRFPTPPDASLQVGVFDRDTGYVVKPHVHPPRDIHIENTAEFLYMESGKAEVTVYDPEWNILAKHVVTSGDFILLLEGGHSLTMLEPTRLIEVKQGPYPGDKEAKVFQNIV